MNMKKCRNFNSRLVLALWVSGILLNVSACKTSSKNLERVEKLEAVSKISETNPSLKNKILFEKIKMADWKVPREGLIDLDDPKAKQAGLKEGLEPIQIYLYHIQHPKFGHFFIDSGISEGFKNPPDQKPITGVVASAMNFKDLVIAKTTAEVLSKLKEKPAGVFLTHMHIDHILGVAELPKDTKVYIGKGESTWRGFQNIFVQGTTDKLLGDQIQLEEIQLNTDSKKEELTAIDFFGDSSLIIFSVPGHTTGSLAFYVQSSSGDHLVLGDTCHTKWAWDNNVVSGGYTLDKSLQRRSMNALKKFAESRPKLKIHPGHQSL